MTLQFGTAPDSWGVWLPEHPSQPSWIRFLNEAQEAGYHLIELGPYGYLPTNPQQLSDELSKRDMTLIAATMIDKLHHNNLNDLLNHARRICTLAQTQGARYLVLMADGYRGEGGAIVDTKSLSVEEWKKFISNTSAIGQMISDEFGMTLSFHPHADTVIEYASQVDQLLNDTDSAQVQLCLDTGHYHYRGGDSAALMRERFSRVAYMHLKSIDGELMKEVAANDWAFDVAVANGVMVEPSIGSTDFISLNDAMTVSGWSGQAIVEQDMFPLQALDIPMPIAKRTREYYQSLGWTV